MIFSAPFYSLHLFLAHFRAYSLAFG
uniref:Uncharacterized protein n=1 Tax=mine drainage metagenome TaxID=410659 RepID=E6QPB2_9ZZZZ